jgi:hypothetical protein
MRPGLSFVDWISFQKNAAAYCLRGALADAVKGAKEGIKITE